jgi:16S rRNA (guanine527-N7)-methyltransferase
VKIGGGEALVSSIQEITGAAGIVLSPAQAALCAKHVALMLEWNRKLNLTSITEVSEVLKKHLLDSLLPAHRLPCSGLALDVGTGAGFPGIPLKIASPGLDMVLLDASRRKVSFLKALIAGLGLGGTRALHGRWEEIAASGEHRGRYALIVMRAVRREETHLSSLAQGLLADGGVFAWWAGPKAGKTVADLDAPGRWPGIEYGGSIAYELSGSGERAVLTWKKLPQPPP